MIHVIAFTGKKGAGKDTAASVLTGNGYTQIALATLLKRMLFTLLHAQAVQAHKIDRMLYGDLRETPAPELAGKTPRQAMQWLGEQARQFYGEDYWVDRLVTRLRKGPADAAYVISDVRYPNEAAVLRREFSARIIRIVRPGHDDSDEHISEQAGAEIEPDFEIVNDAQSTEHFRAIVDYVLVRTDP